MNDELNKLAGLLNEAGWRPTCDAQWTQLEAAIPEIRELLSRPAPAVQVPVGFALVPALDADELAALKRCVECWEDDEGHDVPKQMMHRLAHKGALSHRSAGWYALTTAGRAMLAAAPPTPVRSVSAERLEQLERDAAEGLAAKACALRYLSYLTVDDPKGGLEKDMRNPDVAGDAALAQQEVKHG